MSNSYCCQCHSNRSHVSEYPFFITFVFTLLCPLGIHVHCYFLKEPKNVAGRIGEVVVMNCASNDTTRPCGNLVWARQTSKTSEQIYFSRQDQLSDMVSNYIVLMDSTNGNCNLNITMRSSAEGTYGCVESAMLKTVTAQLIVLEDDPECLVRTDDKTFNITCSVRFLGSWSPTMRWFQVSGTNSVPIDASESIISDQIVRSTALLNRVNVSDGKGHTTFGLQCTMNFSEDRRPDKTSATNVPAYEWTSPIFGGGNEEQVHDTSNDRSDNKASYVAVIATLVVFIVIVIVIVIAFELHRSKMRRHQDSHGTGELEVHLN